MILSQISPVFYGVSTKEFTFVKDHGKWYIDLPEYDGSRDDLRMVSGADTWLDMLSNNGTSVDLRISLDQPLANCLDRMLQIPVIGGAFYKAKKYNGKKANHMMWLCPVTLFVFGKYPNVIYYEVC
jgi:hypothetical protein